MQQQQIWESDRANQANLQAQAQAQAQALALQQQQQHRAYEYAPDPAALAIGGMHLLQPPNPYAQPAQQPGNAFVQHQGINAAPQNQYLGHDLFG